MSRVNTACPSLKLIWMRNVAPFSPRFPNGKSLHLTRKFHYHLPFKALPRTENKRHNIQGIMGREDYVDKSYLDVWNTLGFLFTHSQGITNTWSRLSACQIYADACFLKVCAGSGPSFPFKLCDCQFEDTLVNNNIFWFFFKSMWTLIPHSTPII